MKKIFLIGLCGALLGAAARTEKPGGVWDARLHAYSGSVLVRPAGSKNWANARKDLPLSPGDVVRTGKKSSADISLDGRGVVSLNASAEFDLKNLKRKDSLFVLMTGRLVMKIKGLKSRGETLSVRTPTAVAAVRGTEFGVDYSGGLGETLVNVFEEGEVQVTSLDESGNPIGETITVIPRHEVRVKKEMEALSLAQSPASRYKDPAIGAVRGKLGALEKTYEPMQKPERDDAREQAFGRKGPDGRAAAYDEERGDREGAAAGGPDKAGRKKGGADGDAYAEGGAGQDGKKRGEAGYGRQGAKDTAEDGAGGGRYAKGDAKGRAKGDARDDDGEGGRYAGGHGRNKKGFGDDEDGKRGYGGKGGKGGRGGDDELLGGKGGKSGKSGAGGKIGDDDDHLRTKAGAGGIAGGAAGGKIKGGLAGDLKTAGVGSSSASGSKAGASSIPNLLGDGALSRPTSATDKSVDNAVSRIQSKLAATGNENLLSSAELRTLVVGAAKTSATDAGFATNLNASLVNRLTAMDNPGAAPGSTLNTSAINTGSPGPGLNNSAIHPVNTGPAGAINVTNPNITSPVMTNTAVTNTGVNKIPVKKK